MEEEKDAWEEEQKVEGNEVGDDDEEETRATGTTAEREEATGTGAVAKVRTVEEGAGREHSTC